MQMTLSLFSASAPSRTYTAVVLMSCRGQNVSKENWDKYFGPYAARSYLLARGVKQKKKVDLTGKIIVARRVKGQIICGIYVSFVNTHQNSWAKSVNITYNYIYYMLSFCFYLHTQYAQGELYALSNCSGLNTRVPDNNPALK